MKEISGKSEITIAVNWNIIINMKHYAFYFTVGLLAFISSSFLSEIVYHFSDNQSFTERNELTHTENSQNQVEKTIPQDELKIKSFIGIKFVCEDEKLTSFFSDFLKEEYEQFESEDKLYQCAEILTVKQLDLNGDKKDELIVSVYLGSCGSKGNCPTIIYDQREDKYKRLLFHPAAISFTKMKQKNNRYHNLRMFFNSGVYGGYVEYYKFNGNKYKLQRCFEYFASDNSFEKTKCWNFNE